MFSNVHVGRTFLSDRSCGNILRSYDEGPVKATTVLLIGIVLFSLNAKCQDDLRQQSVQLSRLPAVEQLAINLAIRHSDRQLGQKAADTSVNRSGDASVATVTLGPVNENDLVVTDQSWCSPTGNCSIFVMRPHGNQYRVILEATGQSITSTARRTNDFRDVQVRMHGSATMSEIKIYRFNGSRYLRSGCYDENFEILDSKGNVHDLDRPHMTPCKSTSRLRK